MTVVEEIPLPPHRGFLRTTVPEFFQHLLSRSDPRTYFGIRRRTFILLVTGIVIVLLALILGLSIGLTMKKNSNPSFIPNPSNKALMTGDATYYAPGLGACGIDSTAAEAIAAVSWQVFDAVQVGGNPNTNPLCGRKVWATRIREETGKNVSVIATVVDRCTGCKPTDLDFSPSLFNILADEGLGRVLISWTWVDGVWFDFISNGEPNYPSPVDGAFEGAEVYQRLLDNVQGSGDSILDWF